MRWNTLFSASPSPHFFPLHNPSPLHLNLNHKNTQKKDNPLTPSFFRWHGTILAKLALVPQNILNSYTTGPATQDGKYKQGDFVATFHGCNKDGKDCAKDMQPYFDILDKA